jgi:hypothetical protein
MNGSVVPVSSNCMLVGTMFHRQSKQSVPHVLPNGRIENARPQTCFFPWICFYLFREFPCRRARLPPIKATPTLNRLYAVSRQRQTPRPSFSLRKASLVCTFVPSSRWKHGFARLINVRTVFEVLLKDKPEK